MFDTDHHLTAPNSYREVRLPQGGRICITITLKFLIGNAPRTALMTPFAEFPLVDACFQVKCDDCGKVTWRGCGQHVEEVMKGVSEEDKCTCPR